MPTRRQFLAGSLAQGAALPLLHSSPRGESQPPAAEAAKKKVLIIGGTRFVGPAFVEAALRRGIEVTLFNRGRSNPEMFKQLPFIKGDRNRDLSALKEGKWDAVLDTCGYHPRQVARMAEALQGRVGHYLFVSSCSVYENVFKGVKQVDESSKLDPLKEDVNQVRRITETNYGPLKALCEQAAAKVFGANCTQVRPGYIIGPRDNSDRFGYWAHRFKRGGEILAPGNPAADFQAIDVRDLGEWMVHAVEKQIYGAFNTVGFAHKLSTEELLHGFKICTNLDSRFTWVDDAFLKEHKMSSWGTLPAWIPSDEYTRLDPRQAIAKGLRFRPLGDTLRDTYIWETQTRKRPFGRRALGAEQERELLAAWHARNKK